LKFLIAHIITREIYAYGKIIIEPGTNLFLNKKSFYHGKIQDMICYWQKVYLVQGITLMGGYSGDSVSCFAWKQGCFQN